MRWSKWVVLSASFVSAPAAFAQPVAPGPLSPAPMPMAVIPVQAQRPAVGAKEFAHLEGWEKAMTGMETFSVEATQTIKDLTTKREEQWKASMWLMKPGFARMSMKKIPAKDEKEDPNNMMAYICTGKAIYQYDGPKKVLTEIPLNQNGVGNHLLLDMMSGMTAKAAVARFDVKLLKEDANYIFLEVKPVLVRDKEEFETMTLVLCNPANEAFKGLGYIPRMVILRTANGQKEEHWDFPKPMVNPKGITVDHFKPEDPGKTWKIERLTIPKAGTPSPVTPKLPMGGLPGGMK